MRIKKLAAQFSRFVVIGVMNTAIDFSVLNLLMWWTGIYAGKWIFLLNAASFFVAVINSYFWNKYWTFKDRDEIKVNEFSQFIMVTLIGLAINSGIVYGITTFIPPVYGLSKELWANLAKVVATGLSLAWNFIGYKFIVFKK
jgi:putative flippase GtrA